MGGVTAEAMLESTSSTFWPLVVAQDVASDPHASEKAEEDVSASDVATASRMVLTDRGAEGAEAPSGMICTAAAVSTVTVYCHAEAARRRAPPPLAARRRVVPPATEQVDATAGKLQLEVVQRKSDE